MFSFTDVTTAIFDKVVETVEDAQLLQDEDKVEGRFIIPFFSWSGGCNDAFSGFGFLAFLLALLDLILELNNDAAGRRRRRDAASAFVGSSPERLFVTNGLKSDPEMEKASSACYSMYRGFLNALAATEEVCAKRFLCEGASEAASQGRLGRMIATVASENAVSWLMQENRTRYKDVGEGGFLGARGGQCGNTFSQCFSLPMVYQYPRVHTQDDPRDAIPP